MELTTEPDIYAPSIDINGNYIDNISCFNNTKHGLRCPCGSRKDKVYTTYSTFSAHVRTVCHQKWLSNLNLNKANYYVENEQLKNIVQNQKMVIAQLDKEVQNRNMTIDYLTQQLVNNSKQHIIIPDLLLFD